LPRSFALGDHFEAFIEAQVESGRFNDASDVLRAALLLLEDQASLRQLQASRRRLQESLRQLRAEDINIRSRRRTCVARRCLPIWFSLNSQRSWVEPSRVWHSRARERSFV